MIWWCRQIPPCLAYSRGALSRRVTLPRPVCMGTIFPCCTGAFAAAVRYRSFLFNTECSPAPVITCSCLTTQYKRLNVVHCLWGCFRPKHTIFRFQESVKGHLAMEFKIFLQLSSRPTELVLNVRRKGQQVGRVALKKAVLEMTKLSVWSSFQPSFWIRKHLPVAGCKAFFPPGKKGRTVFGFFGALSNV